MGFDFIYETLESKFDKFQEYQNYLSKDVFGHKVEIQPTSIVNKSKAFFINRITK